MVSPVDVDQGGSGQLQQEEVQDALDGHGTLVHDVAIEQVQVGIRGRTWQIMHLGNYH